MTYKIDHDVHVHTTLSACCGDKQATPANIIARAAETGLRTIGFADHLWDAAVPGAMDWYRPQDLPHVLQTRTLLPPDGRGVRVLVGCESEYCGGGKVGISPAAAGQVDFLLLPVSHFHMKGFVVPADLRDTDAIARLLVARFDEAIELGLATGIAHPFYPVGDEERMDEIHAHISDKAFAAGFAGAAARGVSIEISAVMFPACVGGAPRFKDETFLRMLRLAKRSGCCFHIASDSHDLSGIGRVLKLAPVVEELGLTDGDIHPLFRP
jgi:histidinol phosphatase-like PHP family hydrolase